MNAVANALEAQLSLVDWFKSLEPLAVRSSTRALAKLGSSKTMSVNTYSSVANLDYRIDRLGSLVDRSV